MSAMGKRKVELKVEMDVQPERVICDEEINLLLSILPQEVLDRIEKIGGTE